MGCRISFTILNPLFVLLLALCTFRCCKGCVETERLALLNFKAGFTSSSQNYGVLSTWNSSEECCSWEGISCDDSIGHVVSLDLSCDPMSSTKCYEISQLRPSLLKLQHLRSLDLSYNNVIDTRIPEFIGSLSKLTYLNLASVGFFGMIPPQFANLSNIQTLILEENQLSTDNFQWLSHLSSLESLYMSSVNFSKARDCVSVMINLPVLSEFICESCYFPIDSDLSSTASGHANSSSSLGKLDLSYSKMSSTVLSLLINSTTNLSELELRGLELEVPFPSIFHDMNSLIFLDISFNHLDVGIFNSIGNLCSLRTLYASGCFVKESILNIVQALSPCASKSLENIGLSSMNLTGTIPSMLKFESLAELDLSDNRLDILPPTDANLVKLQASNISSKSFVNGSLLKILPIFPPNLIGISLVNNNLNGVLSDVHFTNISKLRDLRLAHNPKLVISFNKPLVGASRVDLSFCNLGPNFPSWLLTNKIVDLELSHCMISSTIPIMFWLNMSPSITYLNLSFNNFYGIVPNIPFQFSHSDSNIDLSSNDFFGPIPFFLFKANGLYLSNNNFSGFAPIPHSYNLSSSLPITNSLEPPPPKVVDLSNNHLSGLIPHWMGLQGTLGALNLANNNLSGTIPSSIGQALYLFVLNLSNNNFSGPLPYLLKNCSQLRIVDLGGNSFSGFIPSWMGEDLINLRILSLRSNSLTGILPTSLCHLKSLQVLDVSHNLLSGNIPSCIHDFSAMAHDANSNLQIPNFEEGITTYTVPLEDVSYYNAYIKWKSKVWKFQSTLHLVKLIDLSSNNLTGEIPIWLSSLVELDSIDLSCNNLHGSIPEQIGKLVSLQILNLSSNRLHGQIPQSLSEISALEMLDLSHNNFSGRIPKGTQLQSFDPSAFAGNPQLCGLPLRECPGDRDDSVQPPQPSQTDDSEMEAKWGDGDYFFAGLGAGFACGFFGILSTLTWITKWRYAFSQFATHFGEWILLAVALRMSKISRKLQFK